MVIVHILFALLLTGPIVLGIRNILQNRKLPHPVRTAVFPTLLNSAILYALAYNIIFFIQELFLVLGKKSLGLTAYLYHNNHDWDGQHEMTSLMQGTGALSILIVGLFFLGLFQMIRRSKSIWKVFVLWLAFHGLIQALNQVMAVAFAPQTDVGQAFVKYLNLPNTYIILFSVISILLIVLICRWMTRPFLEMASNELDTTNPKAKLRYIRIIAVGGAVLGSIFIIPFRLPPAEQLLGLFDIFSISIPWIWATAASVQHVQINSNRIKEKVFWLPIIILILLLGIFQFILAPGIVF